MARSRRSAAPPRRSAAPPSRSAPAPVRSAPAPAPAQASSSGGGMMAGLGATIAQGMAFGTGSAIAHRAVGAVAESFSGGNDAPQQHHSENYQQPPAAQYQPSSNACFNDQKSFMDCLNTNNNDIASCQFYFDALNQCKQQAASGY